MEKKIQKAVTELDDPTHPRRNIKLDAREEVLLLDTIVFAEPINIWSMLMPAVYQLVPGGAIARMWFDIIVPPDGSSAVFASLMVTSISLALGLIIGDAICVIAASCLAACSVHESEDLGEWEDASPSGSTLSKKNNERGLMADSSGVPKLDKSHLKMRQDKPPTTDTSKGTPNKAAPQDIGPKAKTDMAKIGTSTGETSKATAPSAQSRSHFMVDMSAVGPPQSEAPISAVPQDPAPTASAAEAKNDAPSEQASKGLAASVKFEQKEADDKAADPDFLMTI